MLGGTIETIPPGEGMALVEDVLTEGIKAIEEFVMESMDSELAFVTIDSLEFLFNMMVEK